MFFILGIITCLLIILYRYLNNTFDYWEKQNVPFHPPITFFGNLMDSITMKRSVGHICTDIYKSSEDFPYFGMYKFRQPTLLIRDPEIVNDILIKDFHYFEKNDIFVDEKVDPIISKNPFLLFGPRWKVSRSQLSYCFTSGKMKHMFPLMYKVSETMVEYIENQIKIGGNPMDTKELAGKFTSDNVATCAFGLDGKSFEDPNSEFRNVGRQVFEPTFALAIKLMILVMFPEFAKILKIRFIPEHVTNYFADIILNSLKYRKEHNLVRNDFLDAVAQMKFNPGVPSLTNEEITAHALSFFSDGFETSSIALSFSLYDLAANEDVQQKLRNETEKILNDHNGILSYDAIQDMTYLNCVLSESLRLHPPGDFLAKICTSEYNLPPCGNATQGFKIQPNTPIIIPMYALHHDAKYFPNPEKYDPERFSESNKSDIIKGTYLPFGDGPRICIGMKFALLQVKIALVAIIRNFHVRVNKKTNEPFVMDPKSFLLYPRGGIWLDFHKINI